jgi:CheY-like chemotaxis protein
MKAKILIVEDTADILDVLRIYLETEGYQVWVANTSLEATNRIRAIAPDCILMDYSIPDFEPEIFTREARERNPEVKLILTSGVPNVKQLATKLDCQGHMTKPYDPEAVVAMLRCFGLN